jgi:hypothetical protein
MLQITRETEKKPKELTPEEEIQKIKENQELMQTALDDILLGGAL